MKWIKSLLSKLRKKCFEHLVELEVSKRVKEALKKCTDKQPIYTDLINERNHIENLLNSRFNFFIVLFGSMVAAILVVKNIQQLRLVLLSGAIILVSLTLVIMRAQKKLSIHLKRIRDEHKCSAEAIAHGEANTKGCYLTRRSVNWIIGYLLPLMIAITTFLTMITSFCRPEMLKFFWDQDTSETSTKNVNYHENHFHEIKCDVTN
ncbi:hypothetical protein C900_02352 [Fulvivirga imtechensis AK7]|uniref:Uncharacterized protein n=1 Tax=Fulvivirga imtechensis AK7 TaxID=1237149 RepID=L8JX39_9BACT|nr:hypothetical protein [Fulvivirga imtechensis]ELR71767.1 hypothetical protein C900_02352 [Fulvivirga imtechensis AK7]